MLLFFYRLGGGSGGVRGGGNNFFFVSYMFIGENLYFYSIYIKLNDIIGIIYNFKFLKFCFIVI